MKVFLTVDSHIHFSWAKLHRVDHKCLQLLRKSCTYKNPDYIKCIKLGYQPIRKEGGVSVAIPKKIKNYSRKRDEYFFPRGALRKLKRIFRRRGHQVFIHDHRLSFPPLIIKSRIQLRPEQSGAVDTILKKTQGVVRGPCSVGKSVLLLEAIARAKQPALVIVWDTNHQKQWIKEATNPLFLNLNKNEIGGVGGVFKKPKFGKLNICMQQSLWKEKNREFFLERVGFVGSDEVQRYAATTYNKVINAFPAKYRIGVSANERRRDGKEFLIYDSCGKVIHEIDDSAVASSRIKANIVMVPTSFANSKYAWARNYNDFLNSLSRDKKRNQLILDCVRRSADKGKICLILTQRKRHAMYLKFALRDYNVGLMIGNTTQKEIKKWPDAWKEFMKNFDHDKEFVRVKKLAEQRKLNIVIGTQKGDVGVNVRTLDHVFIVAPTGSNLERFNQQKGRVERTHGDELEKQFGKKPTPCVYYFWDVKMDSTKESGNNIIKNFPNVSVLRTEKK